MMLLDADVMLRDIRYRRDDLQAVNARLFEVLRARKIPVGITAQALLEVIGIMSFNLPATDVPAFPVHLMVRYDLAVFPPYVPSAEYGKCTIQELIEKMK
jgi:hypothetical protein